MHHLNYLFLDYFHLFVLCLHHYLLSLYFFHPILNVRDVVHYVHLLDDHSFFNLRDDLFDYLGHRHYVGDFIGDVYWQLFFEHNGYWYFYWMHYDSFVVDYLDVLYV